MQERQLWNYYSELHQANPRSDSQAKVDFYRKNSEFIKRSSVNAKPELAVIIPAYNEASLIPRTLAGINQALINETSVNIFVVDNSSTDDTAEIAKDFGAIVIKEPNKGVGQARQTGLEKTPSSVKYILTTDADTVVPLNWFESHKKSLESKEVAFTYGKLNFISDNYLTLRDRVLFSGYTAIANLVHTIKDRSGIVICCGANNGFKKEIALECGGYNKKLVKGEDAEIMTRISEYGKVVKAYNTATTSARRIINKGVTHVFDRLKDNYLHHVKKETVYSEKEYGDYRDN